MVTMRPFVAASPFVLRQTVLVVVTELVDGVDNVELWQA